MFKIDNLPLKTKSHPIFHNIQRYHINTQQKDILFLRNIKYKIAFSFSFGLFTLYNNIAVVVVVVVVYMHTTHKMLQSVIFVIDPIVEKKKMKTNWSFEPFLFKLCILFYNYFKEFVLRVNLMLVKDVSILFVWNDISSTYHRVALNAFAYTMVFSFVLS